MRGEIRVIVHATESIEKIVSSVEEVFKIDVNARKLARQDLSGHYGNPIVYLSIKLSDEDVKRLFTSFKRYMNKNELSWFLSDIDDYIERSTLYLRIDKQKLCVGKLGLVEEDPVKIIIKNINKTIIKKWLSSNDE